MATRRQVERLARRVKAAAAAAELSTSKLCATARATSKRLDSLTRKAEKILGAVKALESRSKLKRLHRRTTRPRSRPPAR